MDPAGPIERRFWDRNPPRKNLSDVEQRNLTSSGFFQSDDLDDTSGHYKAINQLRSDPVSRTTSDSDFAEAAREARSALRQKSLQLHPDKHGGTPDATAAFQSFRSKVADPTEEAIGVLGNPVSRYQYDEDCDDAKDYYRKKMKFDVDDFLEVEAQEARYKKRAENAARKADGATALDKCIDLYNCTGQQTNEWRIAVVDAIGSTSNHSEVAAAIRSSPRHYPKGWNGISKERLCRQVYAKVTDAVKSRTDGRLLTRESLAKLSHKTRISYLKAKSPKLLQPRGNKNVSKQRLLEEELFEFVEKASTDGKRITRNLIFRKVNELDTSFMAGGSARERLIRMKKWFYGGFKKRYGLSYARISGAGQKLPKDWQEKVKSINDRVNRSMYPHDINGDTVKILPENWVNSDHVPIYREAVGEYTWGKKNSGRRPIKTAGKEKERFTAQLHIRFRETDNKLTPSVIFRGAAPPVGKQPGKATVAYEILHRLEDKVTGHKYPPESEVALYVSPTANSNGELTVELLEDVILPEIGLVDNEGDPTGVPGGILVDDFKGHSKQCVKDKTKSVPLLNFQIMSGGITPKGQPLDVLVNRAFKSFYRDEYDMYLLTAPVNPKTGNPLPPPRQLIAQWVVKAFNKVPEELVYRSFLAAGYRDPAKESKATDALAKASRYDLVSVVEKALGPDAVVDLAMADENENDVTFDVADGTNP